MVSTQTRMTSRGHARTARQTAVTNRKRRDDANMAALVEFCAGAEQRDRAELAMARAIDEIRGREGSLTAAAQLAGIPVGEARTLIALLTHQRRGAEARARTRTTATEVDLDSLGDDAVGPVDAQPDGDGPMGDTLTRDD